MRKTVVLVLSYLLASSQLFSQLRLPSVISSGMVLQQNDSATLWGWGYNGQEVKATGSWNKTAATCTVSNRGAWSMKIKTPAAGGPYTLRISSEGNNEIVLDDVMIGEVWLCSGQSNMEMSYSWGARFIKEELPVCYNKDIRFFHVPRMAPDYPQEDIRASWQVCDSNSIKVFSAVAYYFGKKLQQDLHVPIGLINSSWGGTPAETWTPSEIIDRDEILKKAAAELQEVPWCPVKPGLTYNGMIAPITKFDIAGTIWYQGEANVGENSIYYRLLTTMLDTWRKRWNKEFPFYYVQIAPFKYGNLNVGAMLQEQQTKIMNYPKTGMVVITDLVDSVTNIHPSNKRDVGYRLANWALADNYKQNIASYKSPMIRNVSPEKDKLILSFDNAPNGLVSKDKALTGFYISGEKEEWLPAEAKIVNDKIIAWNKNLKQPAYIRYGFSNTLIGNVFSKEGLPLCPFRSDNWTVNQGPEKN